LYSLHAKKAQTSIDDVFYAIFILLKLSSSSFRPCKEKTHPSKHTPVLLVAWPIQTSAITSNRRGDREQIIAAQHLEQTGCSVTEWEFLRN
jgi:hypothetical protein